MSPEERPDLAPSRSGVRPRPSVVRGYTRQIVAPEGKVNVTLNSDEHGLLEVFINVGKAGSDIAALAEALGRLVSLNLRMASPLPPNERAREMARQLRGIGGSRSVGFGPTQVRSLPDAVALALEEFLSQGTTGDGGRAGTAAEKSSEDRCRWCEVCGYCEW
jgi:ribonucleoside-diphosphate reductase alpha chain